MLSIGILGAAGIAPSAVVIPARHRPDVTVRAVAARDGARAAAFAARHGIERSHGSYAELLADPDIDRVYIALPNSLHAEWSIRALRAGKDVLCEKPFAMTEDQARRVIAVAEETGRRVMEAFHDRYHPLREWVRTTVQSGALGSIERVEAFFNGRSTFAPGGLRHEPALGGGALMDLGCYPVHWVRTLFPGQPAVTAASAVLNPAGADESIVADLAFRDCPSVRVRAGMADDSPQGSALTVEGTRGRLHVDNMVFPAWGYTAELEIDGARVPPPALHGRPTYEHQLEAVLSALEAGRPLPTEGDDILGNMSTIDAIYKAAGVTRPRE